MKRLTCAFLLIAVCLVPPRLPAQIIDSIAGKIPLVDGVSARQLPLVVPRGVAVDANGYVYITDAGSCTIRRIDPATGLLTVLAGGGTKLDDFVPVPAKEALIGPQGMAFDSRGNLYFADVENRRVRLLTPDGKITTVAGGGFNWDSIGDGGKATEATLAYPKSVAFDRADNLYIADAGNGAIRKVDAAGIITTIAGGFYATDTSNNIPAAQARLADPSGITFDSAGNLYFADYQQAVVRKIDAGTGLIRTIAGTMNSPGASGDNGPATSAQLQYPWGVAVASNGDIYISELYRVRKVAAQSGTITTVVGGGKSPLADAKPGTDLHVASSIWAVALRQNTLYLTLAGDHLFGKLDLNSGIFNIVAGDPSAIGDNGPARSAALVNPYGIALDASGNLYVADTYHHRVRRIAPGSGGVGTGTITTIAGTGALPDVARDGPATQTPIGYPAAVWADPGGRIYVVESDRLREIDSSGYMRTIAGGQTSGYAGDSGPARQALFADLRAIVKDAAGNLYVTDSGNNRIRKIDPGGTITTIAGNGIPGKTGDDGPAKDAQLNYPEALALDGKGGLLVADTYNYRLRRIDLSTGIITALAGDGYYWGCCDGDSALNTSFRLPAGIAVAPNGDLYIADRVDQTVRWVDAKSGIVNTIAGQSGAQGQSGDSGPAREALLCSPRAILSDSTGNLFLADTFNNRIRKISANTQPPDLSVDTCYRGLNLEAVLNSGALVGTCLIVSTSNQVAMNWSVTGKTNDGGNWLEILPASGLGFSNYVWLNVKYSQLSPGDYSASLTATAAGATHSPQSFTLTLKVKPEEIIKPPQLLVSPWTFVYAVAGTTQPAELKQWVWNSGGGTLQWSASAQTDNGGNWLTVTPASGTGESAITLTAKAGSLAPAVYVGHVTFTNLTTKETAEMKVYFIIYPAYGSLALNHNGASFTGNEGAVFSAPREIQIFNNGQAELNWKADIPWAVGGDWLKVTPSSGTLAAASSQTVTFSAVPGSLRSGIYDALVTVNAPNAYNAPQFISARLAIQPADAAPVATIQPGGLALFSAAGGATVEDSFKIYTSGGSKSLGYVISASTFDGRPWLSTTSVAGAMRSSSDIAAVTVRANPAQLTPGTYSGKILVAFDTGVTQTVNVTLVVRASSTSAGSSQAMGRDVGVLADSNCASSQNVVQYSLVDGFSVLPSQSTPLLVRIFDACGTKLTASTVIASFSNGDEPVTLSLLQQDAYCGMWHTSSRGKVTITFKAVASGLPDGKLSVDGNVAPLGSLGLGMPSINPHGVVSAASFAKDAPLAPGQIISLFGSSLGTDTNGVSAPALPLPVTLNNLTAKLGTQDLPLYYANNNQVNAHLPPDVVPGQSLPLVVKVNGMVSPIEMLTFAAVQPGIFLWGAPDPATGLWSGVITFTDYSVVTTSKPAHAGDYIIIWATGLGATTPAVKAGEASPLSPLAVANEPVTVSFGGKEVPAGWAGLTPYLVGLYQINVQIPAGVSTGDTVQVFLKQNGVKSNIVTIPVR